MPKKLCPGCNENLILYKSQLCVKCSIPRKKIAWPNVSIVLGMLEEKSFLQVGRELGVCDNSIRKYLVKQGYNPKTLEPLI